MICPQCGADNAAGRVICHKCGAPLASEEKPLGIVEKKEGKAGSIVGKIIGLVILLCLVVAGGLAFLSFKRPAVGMVGGSAQLASAKKKIEELKREHQNGWDSIISLSEPELNAWLKEKISQVAGGYLGAPTGENVRLEEITLEIAPDVSKAVIGIFWKWKTSYIYLEGKPTLERGFIICHIDKARLGPINLPGWARKLLLGKIITKLQDDTLRIGLPFYVENLICNKGEIVLYTAPEKPGTEGAAPRLFARAEELIKSENYSNAIKVFNRIIDFYEGTSYAQRAQEERDRLVKEAKQRLALGEGYYKAGEYEKALESLQVVARRYVGMEYGDKAEELITQIKADPKVIEYFRKKERENKAGALYQLAENYYNMNKLDLALTYYKKIIDEYPDTSWAEKAREKIKGLMEKVR